MDSSPFARNAVAGSSPRSRAASDIGPRQLASANENKTPTSLPRGFEGMLKTTTETGDIGLFSIKPSRLPQPLNTPRRTGGTYVGNGQNQLMQKPFPLYGVSTVVDDRRRLPSYARDASSDLASLYETASQKSTNSRIFKASDHRSFSMTQSASYSTYTLANQKSYTSLRSQAEGTIQRPRSPFAYPTRLRRPGFRPSSPALTDGGIVDYSRRAEIERPFFESHQFSSSPASLYARRRRPPLTSIRTEANLSTPSLPGQFSPARRSLSPLQRSTTPGNDWAHKGGLNYSNDSPAHSSYSLASTVNLYATPRAPSTTTTPGKISASPLYYDYTEEFENDSEPYPREPPPTFRIEKTIPEERPLSADRLPLVGPSDAIYSKNSTSDPRLSFTEGDRRKWAEKVDTRSNQDTDVESHMDPPSRLYSVGRSITARNRSPTPRNSATSAIEEINDLNRDIKESDNKTYSEELDDIGSIGHLSSFPVPPGSRVQTQLERQRRRSSQRKPAISGNFTYVTDEATMTLNSESPKFIQTPPCHTGAIISFNALSEYSVAETPTSSLCRFEFRHRSPTTSPGTPTSILDNHSVELEATPLLQTSEPRTSQAGLKVSNACHSDYQGADGCPDVCAQNPRPSFSRSIPHVLAPKPISPARQAKLKNSVPQLMKALPPLPSDISIPVALPSTLATALAELPGSFLPLDSSTRSTPMLSQQHTGNKLNITKEQSDVGVAEDVTAVSELDSIPLETGLLKLPIASKLAKQDASNPPPKLRLKMRNSTLRPTSPPNSRPWNLEESYPWTKQQPSIRLPSLLWEPKPRSPKPPKFKLKVTRASNSTQGTVRVNRPSMDLGNSSDFNIRPSKDLFTSNSGLDVMFRKVSRNLKSQRLSSSSSHSAEERPSPVSSFPLTNSEPYPRIDDSRPHTSSASLARGFSPTDVRSFFSDDSSRILEGRGLKKRFSNLRARIAVPYASRNASQSFDDIIFRQRLNTQMPTTALSRVDFLQPSKEHEAERILEKKAHGQKLKEKVSGWLKGARAAFKKVKTKG